MNTTRRFQGTDELVDKNEEAKVQALLAELGKRVQIHGEPWVQYDVPEYGLVHSLRCGSLVEPLDPMRQAEAEKIVRMVYEGGGEPSPGLLVFLGLAIPRAAGIRWAMPF